MLTRVRPAPATAGALDAFDAIVLPGAQGTIVAAVSGGSDSTALLVLLHAFLASRADAPRLVAVTVDHGLRAASAAEAETVARLCARLGVRHETLAWEGPKPATGLMAAAREARYVLRDEAASRHGSTHVLTGHTRDDQYETVAMRAARGPGSGLAGMAPATLFRRRTWFVRPLIGISRGALRAHLQDAGIGWIDDPTNTDPAHERARVRAASTGNPDTAPVAAARIAQAEAMARQIGDASVFSRITPDRAVFHPDAAGGPATAALCHVITRIARRSHLPGRGATAQIARFVEAGADGECLTVHGCLLERRGGVITLQRETRNRGEGSWGGDMLLPSFDHAVAVALDRRLGVEGLAPLPFKAGRNGPH